MSTSELRATAAAPANRPPTVRYTAGSPNASTGMVTGRVIGTDKDKDSLTYGVQSTSAKGGSVTIGSAGDFVYTPTAAARHVAATTGASAADKSDTFAATVDDGHGHLVVTTVVVKVGPANAKPSNATVTGLFTNPNTGRTTAKIVATDPDGDDFTLTGPATTKKGAITYDSATDSFTYVPTQAARQAASAPRASAAAKTDSFNVTLADGHGGTTAATVKVTIARLPGVNTSPAITKVTVGQPEPANGVVTGTVSATDPDRDSLAFAGTATTAKGKVVVKPDGTFAYTPTQAARLAARTTPGDDTDAFTVTVTDGIATTSTTVTATISPARLTLGAPIAVGYGPRGAAFDPDGTRLYVANSGDDIVSVIDTATNTVTGNINVGTNSGPAGLAVTPDGMRLYVALTGDVDGIAVVDTATGGLLTTIVNDGAVPISIAITRDGSRAYVANQRNHSVSVIDTATNTIVSTVNVGEVPFDIVLSNDDSRAYVANVDYYTPVIDTATNTVITTIPEISAALGIAISPDGTKLYTTLNSQVAVLNPATNTFASSIRGFSGRPLDVAFSPDGSLAYVTNDSTDAISVVDTAAGTVIATLHAGRSAYGIAVSPDGRAYVTDVADHVVTPISIVAAGTNTAPVAGTPTVAGVDLSTGAVHGSLNVTDPDGDLLNYDSPITSGKGGSVNVSADGTFTYIPTVAARHAAAADNATTDTRDSFTVDVSDGRGGTLSVPVTLTVSPANQAPTASTRAPAQAVDTLTGTVTGSVGYTDPDGDTLIYGGPVTSTSGGTLAFKADGTYTYTPEPADRLNAFTHPDQNADSFDVVVTDGHGSTQTVTVHVPVDPARAAVTKNVDLSSTSGLTSVGDDGTIAHIEWGNIGRADEYTVLTTIRPDGTRFTAPQISGSAFEPVVGHDGTVVVTAVSGSGTPTDPLRRTVLIVHPDNSTSTISEVTGQSFEFAVLGDDGTVSQTNWFGTGTVDDPYRSTVTVVRRDGTTFTTAPLAGQANSARTGADGTVAVYSMTGSGAGNDPRRTTAMVIHPDNTVTTTAAIPGYQRGESVGPDGTVYLTTTSTSSYKTTVTAIRRDGTAASSTYDGYASGAAQVGVDGTLAVFLSNVDPSTGQFVNTVNVRHPNGTVTTSPVPVGQFWTSAIGARGTVAGVTYSGRGTASDPYMTMAVLVRPDGTTVSSDPITGLPSANPVVGADGSFALSTNTDSGSTLLIIRPDGARTTLPTAAQIRDVEVASDGTVYDSAQFGSGSEADSYVNVLSLDGSTASVRLGGEISGKIHQDGDGHLYQVTRNGKGWNVSQISLANSPTTTL